MSEVFRFVSMRPPQRAAEQDVGEKLIRTHVDDADRAGLYTAIRNSGDPTAARTAADAFASSSDFVRTLDSLTSDLGALDEFLLDTGGQPTPAGLAAEVKRRTDREISALVGSAPFLRDRRRLADSLLALAFTHGGTLSERERLLRAMHIVGLLERVAAKSEVAKSANAIHDFLRDAIVLLPDELFTPPSAETASHGDEAEEEPGRLELGRRGRRPLLPAREQLEASDKPTGEAEAELVWIDSAIHELRSALDVSPRAEPYTRPAVPGRRGSRERVPTGPTTAGMAEAVMRSNARTAESIEESMASDIPSIGAWTLPAGRVATMSRATIDLLASEALGGRDVDVPTAIDRLERRAAAIGSRVSPPSASVVVALGSGVVDLGPMAHAATGVTRFGRGATLARQPGIADLLIVRQEIKRYQLGEIAHIENVLKGENKERIHRTSTITEEMLLTETTHVEELEMDTQSTTRFEMSKEASSAIAEDIKFDAGVRIAGQMGPVAIAASVGFAYSHSKEESERSASSFARETTERARSRVEDQVREMRVARTTIQVEETNKHGIDNKEGDGHVSGVYRWLDKVYEAQIYNYGRRLLVEFVIPEPAAFYLHALANRPAEGITLKKPDPPVKPATNQPLSPADITGANYLYFVQKYEVADVSPPPRMLTIVGLAWDEPWSQNMPGPDTPAKLIYKARKEIKVPAGYKAARAAGVVFASAWLQDSYLAIGSTALRGNAGGATGASMPWTFNVALANEEGDLPVALTIENCWGYAISLEILCERTDEAFVRWQMATFEAIMRAYYELKSQYDSQVAAAATRAGVLIAGRNPVENRAIERTELRKSAIAMLTGQRFEGFEAVATLPPQNYPEIGFTEAAREGPIVQFFEQAFEWLQLTYTFYPYYWGRKNGWLTLSQVTDPDPIFLSFLRAGYARVVAPVRPGFEQAILYYLATGDIWGGSKAPQVGDPLYVSIIQEIQEQLQAPNQGVTVGDPWEVLLPTTLVMLQDDSTLPSWP